MYPYIERKEGTLHIESLSLKSLATQYGTPLFVYSENAIRGQWSAYESGFSGQSHLICFAVKANSNLAVLALLARLGAGFDIVSVGELERVLKAGGDAGKVVFSGVGKRADEIRRGLEVGIRCFNIESEAELLRVNEVAAGMGVKAPVSLRVNPDVDAGTHPYISTGLRSNKFGVTIDEALRVYKEAATLPHLEIIGVDCHIGSQLTDLSPFEDALDRVLLLIDQLAEAGIQLHHIDVGGGLGIDYQDDSPPSPQAYVQAVTTRLEGRDLEVIMEPGRAMVGNAGVMLTKVEFLKQGEEKNFCIVDGAMNDLIRPALYSAWQKIVTVEERNGGEVVNYDVVGPICETGDFLGKDRALNVQSGDFLAVLSSGAYGFVMSSTYNSRPRAAEVMVSGDQQWLVRERETIESLYAGEHIPE
ncbi:MAG: diaminopimelate decarboxylase [Gammaproteobacteria bacterium]|jgi:diaminopimelate decarboxylase|nr:diaminopimelate decarboxylase [Gammaproteobacteria bacterium]MBT3489012.1 diaminopimelate decarboxylase [Gammaproteobacteria bacterium]MBT3719182.1 diaminopimelate decarboxylase [Gammaproteobacteria bacterium]MBT3845006.1 diaminopimelate decarboxylase [Gammaproteobacteria bacterium]MBT3894274.1 diaminopimelate decarboxylase [Gammaproteobacteria bacterium]